MYVGPWREYEGQVKVSCPTVEEKAILDAQKASRTKYKQKQKGEEEETIEETTVLHSEHVYSVAS